MMPQTASSFSSGHGAADRIVSRLMPIARVLSVLALALGLSGALMARAGPPSPETLVHVIDVRDPRISPAGDRIAFVAADSLDPTLFQVWTVDTDGESRPRPFTAGGRSAHEPVWSPDGGSLLFLSARGEQPEQVQIVAADGTGSATLTDEPLGVLAMAWSPDGSHVAYLAPEAPGPAGDPIDAGASPPPVRLRVRDMESGETWTVSPDSASVWQFRWSPVEPRLAVAWTRPGSFGEWRRGAIATVERDGSRWRRLPGRADPIGSLAWSPDGRRLAYYAVPGAAGGEPMAVVAVARPDDELPAPLHPPDWRGTSGELIWSEAAGLVVLESEGVRSFITRLDPESGERTRLAEVWGVAPTGATRLTAARNGAIAFTSDGPDHPAEVFVLDPGAAGPRRLTRMNAQLEAWSWPRPRRVAWSSADGTPIEGLLLLPDGGHPPLPLVVLAHGGPTAHWSLGFFNDPHYPALLLALNGYAVLLPNPRGSTGYGETFHELNDGRPGDGELLDIAAGIDSLIRAGVVDSGRVGIGGFSYGATLAAWGISGDSRYRCAVLGSGLYDFRGGQAGSDLAPYWSEEFGSTTSQGLAALFNRAPIYYVGKVRCPVLVVHGAEDTRLPVSQSLDYFRALRSAGGQVELFIYPREGHRLREPAHLLDLSRRQLDWYGAHLR